MTITFALEEDANKRRRESCGMDSLLICTCSVAKFPLIKWVLRIMIK